MFAYRRFLIFFMALSSLNAFAGLNIHLMLSVDWEGDTLRQSNLNDMARFNREFPHYPVIHFLNAAYYTKDWDLSEQEITQLIRIALKENDELGVHIHAWENFVRASGVDYRQGPSFWNQETSIGRQGEYGDDVPLNTYEIEEIRKMLRFSRSKLEEHGFHGLQSFRGGGWMSGPKVFQALIDEGFKVDSSAVPLAMVENLYPNTLLSQINKRQWPAIEQTSGPYVQQDGLLQYPNNAGLADYLDENEFFHVYLNNLEAAKKKGDRDVYLHFGWHQESAVEYFEHRKDGQGMELKKVHFLDRVRRGLRLIEQHAQSQGHVVVPSDFRRFPKRLVQPGQPKSCTGLLKNLAR